MSREIKFKAWVESKCGEPSVMVDVLTLHCYPNGAPERVCDMTKKYKDDVYDITLLQYTGLRDKNGRKIYEGDIIKDYDGDGIHTVEYFENCFCLVRMSWGEGRDMKKRVPHILEWWDTLEVIGNIHENPELLK